MKKQLHLLKEIVGIERGKSGVLVAGIDVMENGSVVLFDYHDLEILSTYNLGKNKPSCIETIKSATPS